MIDQWQAVGAWGRRWRDYSIGKYLLNGVANYVAWRGDTRLGQYPTYQLAKEAAERSESEKDIQARP
jgi:hypothetical protein